MTFYVSREILIISIHVIITSIGRVQCNVSNEEDDIMIRWVFRKL